MEPSKRILVVGLNHMNANVSCREKAVVSSQNLPEILAQLKALVPLDEVVVLSTCSRVDIFAVCDDTRRGGELIRAWFTERGGAAGLDSWIIGETEILAQTKKAYQSALALGFTRRILNRAFQSAIAAGKD